MSSISPPDSPAGRLALQAVDFAHADGRSIFRQLSLSVTPGEFVVLLGPSGCGKSTLLNLLSGFIQPDRGTVSIDGEAVRPEMDALGYVFQSPHLFPWLTVLDNVRFGLRMRGNLTPAAQQQRARALAPEPKLLLADEPFGALDAITRRHLNEELLRLWRQLGQTVVFITHDIDEAVFLADRVVVLGRAPNGIDTQLTIDLPRPRSFATTPRLPRFLTCREQLMDRIAHVMEKAV